MDPTSAGRVRALAAWLHARRELTERVEVLLMHGPTAVDRVSRHLEELREYYARELAAFEAVAGDEPPPDPSPAPTPPPPARAPEPVGYPPLRSIVLPP